MCCESLNCNTSKYLLFDTELIVIDCWIRRIYLRCACRCRIIRWIPRMLRLHEQEDEHANDQEKKKQKDLPLDGLALVPSCLYSMY